MIRTLSHDDFPEIHRAFVEAFSDYVVPMKPTPEVLREMLTRRGWAPERSSAVFEDDRIVAFTLNGLDGPSGYDSGSGVVPTHRRRGLARRTMEHSIALLREAGATRYVLEVLEPNVGAAALYRGIGFAETRRLDCWLYENKNSLPREAREVRQVKSNEAWCDVEPSWQNSTASIERARDSYVVIGDDDGYAVIFPSNGDLPQLAVRREARRRGVGTRLLENAAAIAQKPLRILNVDTRDKGIAQFLAARGARHLIRQIEMEMAL